MIECRVTNAPKFNTGEFDRTEDKTKISHSKPGDIWPTHEIINKNCVKKLDTI
jgi:hypothetical protein